MSEEDVLKALRKRYKDDKVVMRLTDDPQSAEVIPTGSRVLDHALGIGGVPRGRITEIYGLDASGKTTLCYYVMANAQKAGGQVAYIDTEHVFDPGYAVVCGVSLEDLLISQPDYGEMALEIADALVRSGDYAIVVVDSVTALVPLAELEGDMGASHMGLQARLMSQALRKLAGSIRKSNTAVLFTNQIRMKIGVMYGSPETTTGGLALRFYASIRIELRASGKRELLKSGITRVKAMVRKNKLAPPYKEAGFDILHGEGIDVLGDLLDWLVLTEQIEKKGSYFYIGGGSIGQGVLQAKLWLKENWKEDMASGHKRNE